MLILLLLSLVLIVKGFCSLPAGRSHYIFQIYKIIVCFINSVRAGWFIFLISFSPSLISVQHVEYKGSSPSKIAGFWVALCLASKRKKKQKEKNAGKTRDQFDMSKQTHYNSLSYLPREILHVSLSRQTEEFTCKAPSSPVQSEQQFKGFKSIH